MPLSPALWLSILLLLSASISALRIVDLVRIELLWPRPDPAHQARLDFARSMGPGGMKELRRVREDLTELRRRLMDAWKERTGPGALLAEAMALSARRKASSAEDERKSEGCEGVGMLNRAIADFLFQSDILLDANQTREMLESMDQAETEETESSAREEEEDEGREIVLIGESARRKRKRRQAQTGRNFPRNQWDPAQPIPYVFDPRLGVAARKAVRQAVQFWTEHTCLSFAENGAGFPRVRVFSGGGCYSQVGRAFRQREQMISLGRGCEQFGIAAHELGHTLGFFHGQARTDRDQFVNVVYSNLTPQMVGQFAKQSPEDNNNFGINYDYGSIMHYSDTDTSTSRVTMLAKERAYQHTMGNNVAPSFLDVLEMNLYYKCTDRCRTAAVECKNGGYRHPRNCSTCLCPSGFGGTDCAERGPPENGAPPDCGATVEARQGELQELSGSVSAVLPNGLSDRHSICHFHIKAPAGKRVQLRVKTVFGACSDGCFYGGTELKARDLLRVGSRICCRSDIRPLGVLYTAGELAVVSVFSQYKQQGFTVEFRAVPPERVPPEGVAEYEEAEEEATRRVTSSRKRVGLVNGAECHDIAGNCFSIIHLCENTLYRLLMARQCTRTCKVCGSGNGGAEGDGNDNTDPPMDGKAGSCPQQIKDHESCAVWANNGFCRSTAYSVQIKREICPRQCALC